MNKALEKFNEEERELIYAIYFEEKTFKDIAKKQDTNLMKTGRIRDKNLRKLRNMVDRQSDEKAKSESFLLFF